MAKSPTAEKADEKVVPTVLEENKPLVVADINFEEDAGAGSEEIGTRDKIIPFLNILQKLSPVVNKRDPAVYVEGAEEGHFFNTATRKIYDGTKGIYVIPVFYQRRITEWVPRSKGGGIVKDWGTDDSILATTHKGDKGQDLTATGNEVVQSLTYYALVVDIETGMSESVVLSLSGTQQKRARQWNTIITGIKLQRANGTFFNPATFYMCYHLTTVPDSNEKGSWMSYKIEPYKPVVELVGGANLYNTAKEFLALIKEGVAKADMANEGRSEEGSASPAAGTTSGAEKDDIPF